MITEYLSRELEEANSLSAENDAISNSPKAFDALFLNSKKIQKKQPTMRKSKIFTSKKKRTAKKKKANSERYQLYQEQLLLHNDEYMREGAAKQAKGTKKYMKLPKGMPRTKAKDPTLPSFASRPKKPTKQSKKDEDWEETKEDVLAEEDSFDDDMDGLATENDSIGMDAEDREGQSKNSKPLPNPSVMKDENKGPANSVVLEIERFFNLLLDRPLMKNITDYINWREKLIPDHQKRTCPRKWTDVVDFDVKGFIGILYLMGMQPKHYLSGYWKKEDADKSPEWALIQKFLSKGRFDMIYSCFEEKTQIDPESEEQKHCIFGLDPLLTLFCDMILQNSREQGKYSKTLVFDSSSVTIKSSDKDTTGSSKMKAYLVMESKTGYVLNCEFAEVVEDALMIVDTACKLLNPFRDKGYEVYVGGDYTSNRLFTKLSEMNIKACGKISYQEIEAPNGLKLELRSLPEGVSRQYVFDDQTLGLWKDDQETVCLLSTIHYPRDSDKQKLKKSMALPPEHKTLDDMVCGYRTSMGGGNQFDKKMLEFVNSNMLRSEKPNLVALYFLLEVAMVNSYIMYSQSLSQDVQPLSPRDYRFKIIEKLHEDQRKPLNLVPKTMADLARLEKIQNLSRLGRCSIVASGTCVICRICSIPHMKRVRTKYRCQTCQIPICIVGCYDYHRLMAEAQRFPVVRK